MAQKMTGALVFDERTDRYDIRFDLSHRTWKGADPCRNRANLKTWICLLPLKRL